MNYNILAGFNQKEIHQACVWIKSTKTYSI